MKKYLSKLKVLTPVFTILAFLIEWYLLDRLMVLVNSGTVTVFKVACLFIFPIILWLVVGFKHMRIRMSNRRKTGNPGHFSYLLPFIRLVKGEAGTLNGIVNVLFILVNLAWTPDLLLDWIKGTGSWLYPTLTGLFFAVPFVWLSSPKGQAQRVDPGKRRFLIAGLSKQMRTPENNDSFFSKTYPGWPANWEPIMACLEYYPNLEKVLIIHSDETDEQSNRTFISAIEKDFDKGSVKSLKDLIVKSVNHPLHVEEEVLPPQEKFNDFFPILKRTINAYLLKHGCENVEVVFSINGGTAIVTAGLTFLSMPGQRGCVYSDQNWGKEPLQRLQEFDVNIYTIDELWKEIIEQASGE